MMKTFSVVVEKCPQTGLYVGYVPSLYGAHTQAETLDELQENLREVLAMLFEDDNSEEVHLEDKLNISFHPSSHCIDD